MSEPLCLPSIPCARWTPHGTIEGLQCDIGSEINHNTTIQALPSIIDSGRLIPGTQKEALGQDALSLSACPSQHYGGNVKLVFDAEWLRPQLRSACYYQHYDPPRNQAIDDGLDKESREPYDGSFKGSNRVRAQYGINLSMYGEECEVTSYDPIPLEGNLKRIEYWVPWQLGTYSYSLRCRGSGPAYSFSQFGSATKFLKEDIERVKGEAKRARVPFKVKSCFTALKPDWGNSYIPLNEKNLEMFSRGITPPIVEGEAPQECRC